MIPRLLCIAAMLAAAGLTSCSSPKSSSYAFLGIPESKSSDRGPVVLINGDPSRVENVTAVSETTYQQYELSKQAGRIFTEEAHGDYVYYAVKSQRDVRFDNGSAWVEVIERFKTRKP
jgi:hypothetical protein